MADLTETEPLRCLAAAVLIRAVKDKKVERNNIVVEVDPDAFFARASREGK